jgi:alginate O-acetyltransferase complex protein AlgJ
MQSLPQHARGRKLRSRDLLLVPIFSGADLNPQLASSVTSRDRPLATRVGQICAIAVFALALVAPAVGQIAGWGGGAEAIGGKPPFDPSNPATLIDQSEQWIDHNFGFRRPLIRLNAALLGLVDASASGYVLIGRDGWLFYRGNHSIEQHRGLENFSTAESAQYVAVMDARRKWLEGLGARMMVLVAPDKSTIYPEYLTPPMSQVAPTRFDQLVARAAGTDVDLLELRPALMAAKSKGPLYYKTDSHWTALGAYVAANQLLRGLHPAFPGLNSLPHGAWTFKETFSAGGDLMHMIDDPFDAHEAIPSPDRIFPDHVLSRRTEAMPPLPSNLVWARDLDASIVTTDRTDRPTLLLIGDSFSVALLPFLQQEFSQVAFIAYRDTSFQEYRFIERYRPDIVVFETVERFLGDMPSNPPEVTGGH